MSKHIFLLLLLLIATPARADITSGLVGWWKMDEAASGACSGASVVDSSGQGNTGTCTGSPVWVAGKIGSGAMSFSGSNFVGTGVNLLEGKSMFSVAFWINVTSFPGPAYQTSALSQYWTVFGPSNGYQGYTNTFSAAVASGSNLNAEGTSTTNGYSTGVWYHYVAVYDGTQTGNSNRLKLFINATQQVLVYDGPEPATSYVSGNMLRMASSQGTFFIPALIGILDDVRVYNRALSGAEVAELYQYNVSHFGGGHIGNGRLGR